MLEKESKVAQALIAFDKEKEATLLTVFKGTVSRDRSSLF